MKTKKIIQKYAYNVTFMYDSSGEEYSTEIILAKDEEMAHKKAEKLAKIYSLDESGEDDDSIVIHSIKKKVNK